MLNIAVCGKFHYPKYLKYLHQENFLMNFYCSYKVGENFGIPAEKNNNLFFKEYLYNLHLRTLGERGLNEMTAVYHNLWQRSVKKIFKPAEVNHFMIHGNCTDLIALCNRENTITIGEAVNAHPVFQDRLLNEEAKKRGMKYNANIPVTKKMLAEFDAVDHLLVSSRFVKRTFVENGCDEAKIITLPYGVERTLPAAADRPEKPASINRKKIRVLCVGQITIRKGQYYLLEAIKLLNQSSMNRMFELTLVGRSEPAYMKCLNELSAEFEHIRHIDNSDMTAFMAGFDIFVLPSLEDGFSVVVTEALAAGLPVVTTDNNGAADIIEDGYNGIVVAAGDAALIKRAIERIVDEKITGKKKDLLSWKDYAARLKSNCENLLAARAYA